MCIKTVDFPNGMKALFLLILLISVSACSSIDLTSNSILDQSPINATIKSEFLIEGKTSVSTNGLYISRTADKPELGRHRTILSDSSKGNSFFTSVNDLKPGSTYYVRSFIQTDKKLIYSDAFTLNTEKGEKAKLDSVRPIKISHSAAVFQGKLLDKGGKLDVECGFCLAPHYEPDTSDTKISFTNPIDTFIGTFEGLVSGGTYFVRPYASNAVGITYGEQIEITTYDKSLRPKKTPVRENYAESMKALFYLGATEENGFGGYRNCVLNGFAYNLVPGDIMQETYLKKYAEVDSRIDAFYPIDTTLSGPAAWKTFERTIEKGQNGMLFGATVTLYFQHDILKKILITLMDSGTEKEHTELVKLLSNEMDRSYGIATTFTNEASPYQDGDTFKHSIRRTNFLDEKIRVGIHELYNQKKPSALFIEYCIECD
jgi:hypothetical protein